MKIVRRINIVCFMFVLVMHCFANVAWALVEKHTFNEQQQPGMSSVYHIYESGKAFTFTATENITVNTVQTNSFLAGISKGTTTIVQVKINAKEIASWSLSLTTIAKDHYTEQAVNHNLYAGDTITYFVSAPGYFSTSGAQLFDGDNYVSLTGEAGPERPDMPALIPTLSLLLLQEKEDCNGDLNGTALFDNCSTCVGGDTGKVACTQDCNDDWGGTAILDDCSICVEGNTGKTACTQDCNDEWGGTASMDNCFTCVEGNTGKTGCTQDCNGDWGGTAVTDNCSTCVGGNTSKIACTQDCNDEWGGSAVEDTCGVCGGDGSSCCSLTCSSSGFTYSCVSSGTTTNLTRYCYIGSYRYINYYRNSYSNGHSVTCESQSCGGRLTCTDDTGQSCTMN